jgi:hypothetical protein
MGTDFAVPQAQRLRPLAVSTIHQKVFEYEPALAPLKRAAALAAGKLLVGQNLIRFDAHQLVLRATVRASERRCFGNWHSVGEVGRRQSTSLISIPQNVGGVTVD